jgi:arylsulfatase A-like enzyme
MNKIPLSPGPASWLLTLTMALSIAVVMDGMIKVAHAQANEPIVAKRPNIIIFMVDDLGWNHIGVDSVTQGTHGAQYVTPNLAQMAKEGLSFTHAYAQPNCAPTRAAMLSGQYPARIHNRVYVVGNLNRNGRGGISKAKAKFTGPEQSEDVASEAITIAEAMKLNGYATAHIGKYHVGGHEGEDTMPENVGFDINLGGFSQGHQPSCFATQQNGEWKFKGVGMGHFDRFGKPYNQNYVERRSLPKDLIGSPKHISDAMGDALEETIAKLSVQPHPFYLQFHTYAVHGPVKARPDLKQRFVKQELPKAEYLGFIAGVDENVKRLVDLLEDPNQDGDPSDSISKNTVVFFTSDNGGTHADNLPLKGIKGMFTEGGIRVPLIARWPGTIPAGTTTHRNVHCLDYYPTCLELAQKQWLPPSDTHPLDGESFANILMDPNLHSSRSPIFYLFPGYMDSRAQPTVVAIDQMDGKMYKAFYYYEANAWELYCLTDDPGELTNIVDTQPLVAKALSGRIDQWLRQQSPGWQPAYPLIKSSGQPAGPPPRL